MASRLNNFTPRRPPRKISRETKVSGNSQEVLKLVQAEVSRNNEYLKFAQDQIERDRKFFSFLAACLALVGAVVVALTYGSIKDFRSDLKLQGEQAVESYKAVAKKQLDESVVEISQKMRSKIDDEFRTARVTEIIAEQILKKTSNDLDVIISKETTKQVRSAIETERPAIAHAVAGAADRAVQAMRPYLAEVAGGAVKVEVDKSLVPLRNEVDVIKPAIRLQYLMTKSRAGDRDSIEELYDIANDVVRHGYEAAEKDQVLKEILPWAGATGFFGGTSFKEGDLRGLEKVKSAAATSARGVDRQFALMVYREDYREDDIDFLISVLRREKYVPAVIMAMAHFCQLTKTDYGFFQRRQLLKDWDAGRIAKP